MFREDPWSCAPCGISSPSAKRNHVEGGGGPARYAAGALAPDRRARARAGARRARAPQQKRHPHRARPLPAAARRRDCRARDQTTADFAQPDDIVAGTVHIGAGESQGMRVIARAARAFREAYPGVRFQLHSANAIDLVERLEHGLDDLAVLNELSRCRPLRAPASAPPDAWGVYMRSDDPLAAQTTVSPTDLGDAPLIVPERLWRDNEPTGVPRHMARDRGGENRGRGNV